MNNTSGQREWTAERISALTIQQLKNLRENAIRLGNDAVATLCTAALENHVLLKKKVQRDHLAPRTDEVVVGFHFVCPEGKGVISNVDGTVWTGTWVVDKKHAENGSRIGAYVALHTKKSEPSYLQGVIKDWRSTSRHSEYAEGKRVQIEVGVDFLVEPTTDPYHWSGDGAGEKGYAWGKPR